MDILTGFEGILQVDGYTGYDALAETRRVGGSPLTLAYCRAHNPQSQKCAVCRA